MKRFLLLLGILLFVTALFLALLPTNSAGALPEYSAQTGEPCASCHVSPSGGGPRGPRGQAWVASNKPGNVPDTLESLDILGVAVNEALEMKTVKGLPLYRWLNDYDGN